MIKLIKPSNFPFYFINGELPLEIIEEIDEKCSYYIKNYEYLTGGWDGRVRLLQMSKKGNSFFPIGLLSVVESILQLNCVEYKIETHHKPYNSYNFDWFGFELREYQKQTIIDLKNEFHESGIVSLPTGAGKTLIGLHYAYQQKAPFMVVVHRKELLYQWVDEIKENLNIKAGIVGNGIEEWGEVCTVAMVQTLNQRITTKQTEEFKQYPLIIFDECHTIPSETAYKVAMHFLPKYRIGLSATPYREDNADIKIYGAIGMLTSVITPEYLIEKGYLAKPKFIYLKTKPMAIYQDDFNSIYVRGIVENEYRNNQIAENALKLIQSDKQVYIHVDRIKHGKILNKLIPNSFFISGASKNRLDIIKMFSNGEIKCVISTLLKEGVNVPSMDALIYASGKKSAVANIQTIGRVLRPQVGKNEAIIIDIADCGNRLLLQHFNQRKQNYIKVFGKLAKKELS